MIIKKISGITLLLLSLMLISCVDNDLNVSPDDEDFPLQLVLDTDEGADLADAEDYGVEVKFADHATPLPSKPILLHYKIADMEGDLAGNVSIDKIIYEYEDDDCVYEREISFESEDDNSSGTITIPVDENLATVPESFEVIFTLPATDDTEGSFSFSISDIESSNNVILGSPLKFSYEVLDNDVAGDWNLDLANEQDFKDFKSVFQSLNTELETLTFEDITGKVNAEFEFGEMKFVIELSETSEEAFCENGEIEIEVVNKEIEIEADYEAEDDELILDGGHFVTGDDGEIEDELDFQIESTYSVEDDVLTITFTKVIDEEHFDDGDELFTNSKGLSFNFTKD